MSDDAPEGLLEAFWAYETALMSDDLETLDALFADRPDTLRGDAAGVLVGHETISRFRGSRGGAPRRTIAEVHVRVVDATHALVVAVTAPERGGRGQQTQLWERTEVGWQVTAAHVAVPAPAVDVADTIGAGDTVHGALLAYLDRHDALDVAVVRAFTEADWSAALTFAARAAAVTVSRPGADPPWSRELGLPV